LYHSNIQEPYFEILCSQDACFQGSPSFSAVATLVVSVIPDSVYGKAHNLNKPCGSLQTYLGIVFDIFAPANRISFLSSHVRGSSAAKCRCNKHSQESHCPGVFSGLDHHGPRKNVAHEHTTRLMHCLLRLSRRAPHSSLDRSETRGGPGVVVLVARFCW
jgi:hypothetical protein